MAGQQQGTAHHATVSRHECGTHHSTCACTYASFPGCSNVQHHCSLPAAITTGGQLDDTIADTGMLCLLHDDTIAYVDMLFLLHDDIIACIYMLFSLHDDTIAYSDMLFLLHDDTIVHTGMLFLCMMTPLLTLVRCCCYACSL